MYIGQQLPNKAEEVKAIHWQPKKVLESFRSPFTMNVDRSCDRKSNVNVHCKRLALIVVSDQRTRTIPSLKPLALNC